MNKELVTKILGAANKVSENRKSEANYIFLGHDYVQQLVNEELLDWVDDAYKWYESSISLSNCVALNPQAIREGYAPDIQDPISKEEFIQRIKTDFEFAESSDISVNRRELTLEERKKIYSDIHIPGFMVEENVWLESKLRAHNIPKQVITLTLKYNNKTIEVYE